MKRYLIVWEAKDCAASGTEECIFETKEEAEEYVDWDLDVSKRFYRYRVVEVTL